MSEENKEEANRRKKMVWRMKKRRKKYHWIKMEMEGDSRREGRKRKSWMNWREGENGSGCGGVFIHELMYYLLDW